MNAKLENLRIDVNRFQRDFERLAEIGSTGDGGVHRPALSPPHLEARKWFRELIQAEGFEFMEDAAGNHSARLPSEDPEAKTFIIGSHLDSVPYGGRFDGPLGVLAGFEALRTIRDANIHLPVHLEAIDFTDEEGTLIGLLGSRALAGSLSQNELMNPRGGREALQEAFKQAGMTEANVLQAQRDSSDLAGFLEVHIEQGPRLLGNNIDIGIVQTLVGIGSISLTFVGRADHAGTTPMDVRLDAGLGAAEFILSARRVVLSEFPGCVVNVGRARFYPGALNIVPASARVFVEFRSSEDGQISALEERLLTLAETTAKMFGLQVDYERLGVIPPTQCSPSIQDTFERACEVLALKHLRMDSGAGHDTMAMADICPAGMIFIPSTGGSHSPREFATWEACINGANVLLQTTLLLWPPSGLPT
jgi:N-carbamoyl-L-amino-acid hydrolase